MKILRSNTKKLDAFLATLKERGSEGAGGVADIVGGIIAGVRSGGDAALIDYTEKFDKVKLNRKELRVTKAEIAAAVKKIPKKDLELLKLAATRIEDFHERQREFSWYEAADDGNGTVLGQKVTPIEKAGIYVPGGKASYPSTVLMNAIPARVAGVKKLYMVTPPGRTGIDPYVLAAASIAKVDAVFRVGGAQAVAALAYGTSAIPKVDKITGPGNIFVATAKRLVYGVVDIDMIAGPSEILIINDGSGKASWIAADLLSQAEHDELASAILITTSTEMAKKVSREVGRRVKKLKRRKIAEVSVENFCAIIIVKNLKEAFDISNAIAPEHLELFVKEPFDKLDMVQNAGAIFMGEYTPEAVGDYLAGPNHTLPTGGTARFSSPLGVSDFIKRSSVISFSKKGYAALGKDVKRFADLEGLEAHGISAGLRIGGAKKKQKR